MKFSKKIDVLTKIAQKVNNILKYITKGCKMGNGEIYTYRFK